MCVDLSKGAESEPGEIQLDNQRGESRERQGLRREKVVLTVLKGRFETAVGPLFKFCLCSWVWFE